MEAKVDTSDFLLTSSTLLELLNRTSTSLLSCAIKPNIPLTIAVMADQLQNMIDECDD